MRKAPLVIAHGVAEDADYAYLGVRLDPNGTLVADGGANPDEPPAAGTTFQTALATLGNRVGLAVEPEDGRAMVALLSALKRRPTADDVLVFSCRIRDLWHAQRRRPDLRYVLRVGRRPDPAAATRFWGVAFPDAAARPRQLELARSLGLASVVLGVEDAARMRELASLGVEGVVTDRPGLLRSALED